MNLYLNKRAVRWPEALHFFDTDGSKILKLAIFLIPELNVPLFTFWVVRDKHTQENYALRIRAKKKGTL